LFAKYKNAEHPANKSAAKEAKTELRRSRRKFEKKLADNIKSRERTIRLAADTIRFDAEKYRPIRYQYNSLT